MKFSCTFELSLNYISSCEWSLVQWIKTKASLMRNSIISGFRGSTVSGSIRFTTIFADGKDTRQNNIYDYDINLLYMGVFDARYFVKLAADVLAQ